jgi:hypothetical protein
MSEMEQLLSQLPCLKYLELKARAKDDIANGYQWEVLTNSLITFNFKFSVSSVDISSHLSSFCTPFWLEEKRWFVAYQNQSLFSIPHFAPHDIDISEPLGIFSTAPNITYLYNHVNKIIIKTAEIKHNHYFTHVQTLKLERGCTISLKTIQSIIDLNHVEHLIVSSVDNLLLFMPLKCTMPQLHKLTFYYFNIEDEIEQVRRYRFEQILKLELRAFGTFTDYIIEELFRLFPSVQHLEVACYIYSEETMIRVIDGFKHLSNASFRDIISPINHESSLCQNANKIIQHSEQLTSKNFRVRRYRPLDNNSMYNWWIDKQVSNIHNRKLFFSSFVFSRQSIFKKDVGY